MTTLLRHTILPLLLLATTACAQSTDTVRVGLGYLPDVQFAPFYTAAAEGFYKEQGLEVEFQHGFVSELYPLLAQGRLDFVVGDAEDVISLRAQDPDNTRFVYLMALFQRVPSALFSLPDANITEIEDLAGKTVGLPGLFGSSYTSFQGVLQAADLTEDDLSVEQIGFTQLEAILGGRVDVAMGFINNEPLVLAQRGVEVNVIPAGDYNPAPGAGVVTTEAVLENEDLVRRFLSASQEALALTLEEPERAFEASRGYVENLDEDRLAVLEATLPLFTSAYSEANGVGFTNPARWDDALTFLQEVGRVETDLSADTFFSNEYLDPAVNVEGVGTGGSSP